MNENELNNTNNQENNTSAENQTEDKKVQDNPNPNSNSGWHMPNENVNENGFNNRSYNSGSYQPPKYGNGNEQNEVPPYQNPANFYHNGKFSEQGENDNYKWNLDDYKPAQANQQPPVTKKKNKGLAVFLSMVAIILGISVIGFASYGIYAFSIAKAPKDNSNEQISSQADMPNISINDKPTVTDSSLANGELSSVEISRKVKPTVVGIQAYSTTGFGVGSEGSGIIISADGYIITNAHVVENSSGIKVIFDNDEAYSAKLIGSDTQSDIAVIKVEAENLAYADLGNSDQVEVGEKILAIGNPSGMELSGSVTQGIVSAINRNIKTEAGYNMKFIQVDAAINPGNSGGALVNAYGQIIGINSAKISATDYEGIGFAIPINEAMTIVNDLIKNGRVTGRAMLGFSGIQVDSVDATRYGIPLGISIQQISENSDLVKRNILPGDIITKLDGNDITDFADIRTVLAAHKPGDSIEMVVYRTNNLSAKGQYLTVSVTLIEDSSAATSSNQVNP